MLRFDLPDQAQAYMANMAPGCSLRPLMGSRFKMSVSPVTFKSVSMFVINANTLRATIPPGHAYFGITIPAGNGFSIHEHGSTRSFSNGSAHFLNAYEIFDFRTHSNCKVLGANFFVDGLRSSWEHLLQKDSSAIESESRDMNLSSHQGLLLQREITRAFAWGAKLSMTAGSDGSDLAFKELEDDMLCAFALAASDGDDSNANLGKCVPQYLKTAEEFLAAHIAKPVSRDRLAKESGVCIRTLNRAFSRFHGTGPMAFLKRRRMEAAFLTLAASDPSETSVTAVATRYGLSHLGRFSIDYLKVFGESPSQTLSR